MSHPKRKKVDDDEEKQFFCLRCYNVVGRWNSFSGKIKMKNPGRQSGSKYISRGLSRHLTSGEQSCGKYYEAHGLVRNGKFDFSSSISRENEPVAIRRKYTQEEFGLTGSNTVDSWVTTKPSTKPSEEKANTMQLHTKQVIHNLLQPHISREAIIAHQNTLITRKEDHGRLGIRDDEETAEFGTTIDEDGDAEKLRVEETMNETEKEKRRTSDFPATPRMKAEIELLQLIKHHKMPLKAFQTIWDWAVRSQKIHGFKFEEGGSPRSRGTILDQVCQNLHIRNMNTFKPKLVPWLPDNNAREIYICEFQDALVSLLSCEDLMKEENLSFPNSNNPTSPEHYPELTDDVEIRELHHGSWWCDTWKDQCQTNSNEMMVPVILYMDGISLDVRGNLSLTPMNMTLGIFNLETRNKANAWRTIYFHPDVKQELDSIKKTDPADKVQNLHTGIRAAMSSFKNICDIEGGVCWDFLPYAGKEWKVRMKFSIAYVIGDTEMHDRLCGRYQARTMGVSKLCRHCQCDTENICNPSVQYRQALWKPSDFHTLPGGTPAQVKENSKRISHHSIHNAFHELNFGYNDHNIHLASPGECLHMHQLGVAKRAVESFKEQVSGKITDIPYATEFRGNPGMCRSMGLLGQEYGALLCRQSDRDFPRSKFGTDILNNKRKEGHDFAGVLISILIALVSKRGLSIVNDPTFAKEQIRTIEWILSMEEFLKHGKPTIGMRKNLQQAINQFVKRLNKTCLRSGMGMNLIKTHLYFHLPKYMELWGPPSGWDSAPSESHHKTEIKAPSKNTQRRASNLVKQTTIRQSEQMLIETAMSRYSLRQLDKDTDTPNKEVQYREGARFDIRWGDDGTTPTMKWCKKRDNAHFPHAVLLYCCKEVLPLLKDTSCVQGCTEHKRFDKSSGSYYLFRSHPSYRSNSGQQHATWMDWAAFRVMDQNDEEMIVPGQVVCFLKLREGDKTPAGVGVGAKGGVYAVVRSFKEETKKTVSNFVSRGQLDGCLDGCKFELYDTETIVSEIAVVPDLSENRNEEPTEWLVVKRRAEWLRFFEEKLDTENRVDVEPNQQ